MMGRRRSVATMPLPNVDHQPSQAPTDPPLRAAEARPKGLKSFLQAMRQRAVADYERDILDFLEPSGQPVALLDCGCNDGAWTQRLGARLGSGRLHGIEFVEERRRLAVSKGINALWGDLNNTFPFPEQHFDAVHASQVIEHLADTDAFIQEIWRVLKPGGYAIICTENLASWHNIFALLWGWQPFSLANVCEKKFQIGNPLALHNGEAASNPKSWLHTRVFAYRGLKEVFAEHGFKIERATGSGYFPLPSFLGRLDPRHAAFLTLKARKPR